MLFDMFQLRNMLSNMFQLTNTLFNMFQLTNTLFNIFQLTNTLFNMFQLTNTLFIAGTFKQEHTNMLFQHAAHHVAAWKHVKAYFTLEHAVVTYYDNMLLKISER